MVRRDPDEYVWKRCLFDETILNRHYTSQAPGKKKYVVLHHMAIVSNDPDAPDALDTMYNVWQTRPASAHYGVDDYFVRQYVWDKDYAWATGNTQGNIEGISIEHANIDTKGWLVRRITWKTGAKLTAAIHIKEGWGRPTFRTIKQHNFFKPTACPGPFMEKIRPKYIAEAQKQYDILTGARKLTRGPNIDAALASLYKAKKQVQGFKLKRVTRAIRNLKRINRY